MWCQFFRIRYTGKNPKRDLSNVEQRLQTIATKKERFQRRIESTQQQLDQVLITEEGLNKFKSHLLKEIEEEKRIQDEIRAAKAEEKRRKKEIEEETKKKIERVKKKKQREKPYTRPKVDALINNVL